MKKIISVLLVIAIVTSIFAACGSNGSGNGVSNGVSSGGKAETSYYSWVGRFDLYKWEMNGTVLVGDDIAQACHPDQYVLFNKNGTGQVAFSLYPDKAPEVCDIKYTYDLAYQNGYINVFDEGESLELRFEISGNLLTLELYGAKMTFKKV